MIEKLVRWLFPQTIACISLKARFQGWTACEDNALIHARAAGNVAYQTVLDVFE
jgi:hypothetical protein